MAYRLKIAEPIDDAFRRIAAEQIELAVHELAEGKDRVAAVHETRKALKRIRALLKLVRSGLPRDVYSHENARFRDIARSLAGTRDRDVLRATAARLAEGASAKARKAAATLAADDADDAGAAVEAGKQTVREAIDALEKARTELATLRFEKKRFAVVRRGLEAAYRRGRRAMHEVLDEHHDEAFHEWRKAVQAHWRQMQLLTRAWPGVFEARSALAKEISELLGEDHDLAVLVERLAPVAIEGGECSGSAELVAAARQRQSAIRADLRPKADALYVEAPSEFVDRIGAYWSAAKAARDIARNGSDAAESSEPKDEPAPDKPAARAAKAKTGRAGSAAQKSAARSK